MREFLASVRLPAFSEAGFMDCPACCKRTPAKLKKARKWYFLGRLPIPLIPDLHATPLSYQCMTCKTFFTYVDPSPYDFGPHGEPRLWSCPQCSFQNPASTYDCLKCDYSMNRSLGDH